MTDRVYYDKLNIVNGRTQTIYVKTS